MILQPHEYHSRQLKYKPLEPIAATALQQCGMFNPRLRFVSDTGNVIFRADAVHQSYAVRIYPEPVKTVPEIQGELYWLLDLAKNSSLTIPKPIAALSGHLVQEIATADREIPFQVVVFHWIPGEIIGSNCGVETARQLGGLMADLHTHAATFVLPTDGFRDTTDWRGMGHFMAGLTSLQISRIEGFLDKDQLELCEEVARRVAPVIDEVDNQQNFGLVHSDLHTNNCLFDNEKIAVIDFEDCQFAPFTCDIAITISSFDNFPNPTTLQQGFLQGYLEKHALPLNYAREIEAFRVERRLRLIRWVSTWPSVDHFSFGRSILHNSLQHCREYIK